MTGKGKEKRAMGDGPTCGACGRSLDEEYRAMAADAGRETEARAWLDMVAADFGLVDNA